MIKKPQLKMLLVGTDDLDESNTYYLYEVWNNNLHYYFSTSDEEQRNADFHTTKTLIERSDMNDNEWHIAKTLFDFLWNSNNGTNTCMDYDQLSEEHISKEDVENFIDRFMLNDCLDVYEHDGVEIYWDFLCSFDLNTCDFFEKNGNKTYHVVITTILTKEYDLEVASEYELKDILKKEYCDIDDDNVLINTETSYKLIGD